MPRAGYAVVHFLEQNNIRLIVTDGFHDPLGAIEAVYAANPLVDVVRYKTESHVAPAPSSASSATVSMSLASDRIRVRAKTTGRPPFSRWYPRCRKVRLMACSNPRSVSAPRRHR